MEQMDQIREMGTKTAIWFADDPYFTDLTKRIAPHYECESNLGSCKADGSTSNRLGMPARLFGYGCFDEGYKIYAWR